MGMGSGEFCWQDPETGEDQELHEEASVTRELGFPGRGETSQISQESEWSSLLRP